MRTMRAIYEVAFVIAPVIGHETEAVLSSPTLPERLVHSETSAENEYEGFVALTAADVGFTTIVVTVPTSDVEPLIVCSTLEDAKSWWNSRVTELSFKPATRVFAAVEENAVVSTTSVDSLIVIDAMWSLKFTELIVTEASVRTMRAII